MATAPEWMGYVRALLALVFVAGLIFLFAGIAKKTGLDKRLAGNKGGTRRLEVMETLYLDPKHRMVLVRCGTREHLLLVGTAGDLLIESRERSEMPDD